MSLMSQKPLKTLSHADTYIAHAEPYKYVTYQHVTGFSGVCMTLVTSDMSYSDLNKYQDISDVTNVIETPENLVPSDTYMACGHLHGLAMQVSAEPYTLSFIMLAAFNY